MTLNRVLFSCMHWSENCQSEISCIVNNRERSFLRKTGENIRLQRKEACENFRASFFFFFRCKVDVRWRTAGLFLYCLLDYPSMVRNKLASVLGMGRSILALQRGWKSWKSISASKQFVTCPPYSQGRIMIVLKMFKSLVYIPPEKRRGEDQWGWSTGLQIECFIFFVKVCLRLLMTYLKLLVLTSDINLACWLSSH